MHVGGGFASTTLLILHFMENLAPASKGEFTFELDGNTVLVSGNFDSGNCGHAEFVPTHPPHVHSWVRQDQTQGRIRFLPRGSHQ